MEADDQSSRITELVAKNAELAAKNAELVAKNAELAARVELLVEKLNQNSSNSHHPPSSDGPGAGAKRRSKKDSPRKRGGHKGHRGAHRELAPIERVDEFVELFPSVCLGCGAALPRRHDAEPRRYQLLELLLGKAHITEFRRHEVPCGRCGYRTLAAYDRAKIPASPFGPRLVAVVAMLTGVYHLSRRKARQLLRELFGIEISLGALSGLERRASQALQSAFDDAAREVEQAAVKHTDATSWLRAGVTMSLWTVASAIATVFHIVDNGRRETIQPLVGRLHGVLVSDRASVFGFWRMPLRQICWAHLLRKFVSFSERDGPKPAALGRELLDCAGLVFDYWHGFRAGELTREELDIWMRPVRRHFEAVLQRAVAAGIARVSGSCADILAHADALWTFVTHEGVEPTNNHAERELRGFVLWRKRSFGSQSERGDRFAERVMTVAHTIRKRGEDVLDFIVRSVTAHVSGSPPPPLLVGVPA